MDTTIDVLDSSSIQLAAYDPCEQRAILEHKYYLGIELGFDPGLGEAIASWEARFARPWRRRRHREDCLAQIAEIEDHRRHLSELDDQGVSWEDAAHDWIGRYAAQWRHSRQSRP